MLGFSSIFMYNASSYWILTLLIFLPLSVCGVNKFCGEDYCNNSKQHTMCKYQSGGPAANCIDYAKLVNGDDKSVILHKINRRRGKVAAGELSSLPSAENMLKMVWSDELATSAQRWADQCVQHSVPDIRDSCRDLDSVPVAQSIATVFGEAPGLTAAALVDVWFTELLNLNASVIERYRPSIEVRSTHYEYFTQLVWANSYEVGCGGVRFKQTTGIQKNQLVHRLVCNFAPAGNRVGEPVYAAGAACSQCPDHGSCDDGYRALCRTKFVSTASVHPMTPTNGRTANEVLLDGHASRPTQTEITSSVTEESATSIGNDDQFPVFEYFSHSNIFPSAEITTVTDKPAACKEVLAIDELLELLKKKLSSDPLMKDLLLTKKSLDQTDNGFTDAGVAAFVSRLYSKKEILTTTKPADMEYVNSTLLADLVEAVIFRGGERYVATEKLAPTSSDMLLVSPVRIQPEFAKVKMNDDFTGHYFFPEEEEPASTTKELADTEYYTASGIPISDVVLELEDIKRNTEIKDFVDEILESDSATEAVISTRMLLPEIMGSFNIGHNNMKKFLDVITEGNDEINSAIDLSVSSGQIDEETDIKHL